MTTNNTDSGQKNNLWIGIKAANINSTLAQRLGLNESQQGVMITEATPGGPAQKAGLRSPEMILNTTGGPLETSKADILLKIDNVSIDDITDIGSTIQTKNKGDNVTLDVLQDGQINKLSITPMPMPDYLIFNDPEGSYTISYPINWLSSNPSMLQQLIQQSEGLRQLLTPEEIQNLGAKFYKLGSETSITITKSRASAAGVSGEQLESMADDLFTQQLMRHGGTIIQDMECERYEVEGSKACSNLFSSQKGSPSNIMQVLTIVGGRVFLFSYSSLPKDFEKDLPVLEEMLKSFNRTGLS
jgi:PDZ domain